ncbi:MAG: DUF2520 domain-containing protein [Chloroflexi bacterium]|nr:DUF2520 domain-containing protein [Chloroflexota bacterium]
MTTADPTPPPGMVLGFVGAGTLGTGLALALHQAGCPVGSVSSRRFQSARALADKIPGCVPFPTAQEAAEAADLVFITTPDSVIETVAGDVRWRHGQYVVHCCGALGREALQAAESQGAETGAFHPFQTFAGLDEPALTVNRLAGVTFAVSAEGRLESFLKELADRLGGRAVSITEELRPLYHASAVLSCGYLVTLLEAAVQVWQAAGFTEEDALNALAPVARATLENVASLGPRDGVTGPLYRGDVVTVRRHLEALSRSRPDVARLYLSLTEKALPLAMQLGMGPDGIEALERTLAEFDDRRPDTQRPGSWQSDAHQSSAVPPSGDEPGAGPLDADLTNADPANVDPSRVVQPEARRL